MDNSRVLCIYVDEPDDSDITGGHSMGQFSLQNLYCVAANSHNHKIDNTKCADSGFDIYYPGETGILDFSGTLTKKIDFKISACMLEYDNPVGYYMYPRSSLSKTSLRLANNVGIIDSGYRGHLCGMFDIITRNEFDTSLDGNGTHKIYNIEQAQRLLQICTSDLKPFKVRIVNSLEELGETSRGSGGFGSTGSAGAKK